MPIHGWTQHEAPPVFRCRYCGIEVRTGDLVKHQSAWEREHVRPFPVGLVRPSLDMIAGLVPCTSGANGEGEHGVTGRATGDERRLR